MTQARKRRWVKVTGQTGGHSRSLGRRMAGVTTHLFNGDLLSVHSVPGTLLGLGYIHARGRQKFLPSVTRS